MLLIDNDAPLGPEWLDRPLKGDWADHRECHIGGDLLLVGKCAECRSDVARVIEGSQPGQASNPATTSRCATQSVGSGFRWNHSRLMHLGCCPARMV